MAEAFAGGDSVSFGGAAPPAMAAHEAAHVIQQRQSQPFLGRF